MNPLALITQSYAPLRRDPSHRSEMVTQLLFGEEGTIEQEVFHWYRITSRYDGSTGWIEANYLRRIPPGSKTVKANYVVAESGIAKSGNHPEEMLLLLPGTLIRQWDPLQGIITCFDEVWQFEGGTIQPIPDILLPGDIIHTAKTFLGVPFLWGGVSTAGMDCSGLVQTVFRINGIVLPRKADEQSVQGTDVHFLQDARPGDLVFFSKNDEEKIVHSGILIDQNRVIHVAGSVVIDHLDQEGIPTGNYHLKLRQVKRIVHDIA